MTDELKTRNKWRQSGRDILPGTLPAAYEEVDGHRRRLFGFSQTVSKTDADKARFGIVSLFGEGHVRERERTQLKELGSSERHRFTAVVERHSTKTGWTGWPVGTILLRDVRTELGEVVADHLWFTEGMAWLGVRDGDVVEFCARVAGYEKGYRGRRAEQLGEASYGYDYKLSYPTQISVTRRLDG